jgi:PAS domain S-box-containing protein
MNGTNGRIPTLRASQRPGPRAPSDTVRLRLDDRAPAVPPQASPAAEADPGESWRARMLQRRTPYEELLHGLYDAVLITNGDGDILDANARALGFFGYDLAEVQALNVRDLIAAFGDDVLARLRHCLEDRPFVVVDAQCVRKDRSSFAGETAVSRLQLTNAGELLLSIRNVEKRRKTQELIRSEHNALQHSACAIAITDTRCVLEYVNPAFLRLWRLARPADAIGKNVRAFLRLGGDGAPILRRPLDGASWVGELEAWTHDGDRRHVQTSAAPNTDGSGQVIGIVLSFVDITEQRRAEERLRREAEAQLRRARERSAFSGTLNVLSIVDLVQLIAATGKCGKLSISSVSDGRGEFHFLDGQIVSAVYADSSGDEAVFRLIRNGGEEFEFEPAPPTRRDPSITRSTLGLLLDAVRRSDEAEDEPDEAPTPFRAAAV